MLSISFESATNRLTTKCRFLEISGRLNITRLRHSRATDNDSMPTTAYVSMRTQREGSILRALSTALMVLSREMESI